MKKMPKIPDNFLLILKIVIFVFILISPFISYKNLNFMNTVLFKVIILILIVLSSFIDLQLAIVLTLAFLILMINLNKNSIFGLTQDSPMISEHFAIGLPIEAEQNKQIISEFPDDNVKCSSEIEKEKISNDLFNLYIDPKIKPYEMYIQQLSNPELIEKASNGLI